MLEADYSVALQLMLKYPAPPPPHGPHTFVDDAMYLKAHFDAPGGVTLIFKYTGKSPASTSISTPVSTPAQTRSATPSLQKLNSLRQRTLGARSPLSASARILQQPGGVEALLQGAAKNMMERGEKLGINQAVRDAVGEIRRNVQGIQETRNTTRRGRELFGETGPSLSDDSLAVTLMERRNRRLAAMLDESLANLRLLVASELQGDREKHVETVQLAVAKIQLVGAFLEDSTLALPEEELPTLNTLTISSPAELGSPTVALDITPVVMTSAVEETRTTLSSPNSSKRSSIVASPPEEPQVQLPAEEPDAMDVDHHDDDTLSPLRSELTNSPPMPASTVVPGTPPPPIQREKRPNGPIPTRSTLAQSSFAWMLEPDTTTSSLPRASPPSFQSSRPTSSGSGSPAQKKRANPSRERNAFLFGEVTADGAGQGSLSADQIFGLQPIQRGR